MARRLIIAIFALAAWLGARADTHGALHARYTAQLWEHRGGALGIVDLYRASDLLDAVDSGEPFEAALRRVVEAPDADPELQAHAAARLSQCLRDRGALEEADRLDASLGYLVNWRVLGPFDDDNKQGYDLPFPPEIELQYEGTFKGKSHSVTWRPAPGQLTGGMDPSENVAGYALTFVKAGNDTPCVLRGGYNEAYKLWVNGELIAARKQYNGRAFDQFADPCTLRKGWNIILVKVCNQEAGWNFLLRATDAAGRALRGLAVSNAPREVEEGREAILAKDGQAPPDFRFSDPEAWLKAAAEGEAPPEAVEAYGLYMILQRTFDRTDDRALKVLRRAAESAPSNPEFWVVLGDSEVDHNRQRTDYQAALDAAPGHVLALERMARYYLERGMPFAALPYLSSARRADPDDLVLRALEGRVRLQYITDGLATADLREAYAAHPRCRAVAEAYLEALQALGQSGEGEKLAEALRLSYQTEIALWFNRISDLARAGRSEEALSLFGQMEARFPLDRTVRYRHATFLLALSRAAEAQNVLAPALLWCPDWPEGHDLAGDIHLAEGRNDQALSEYQQSLILRPQMEAIKRKVEFLSPQAEGFEAAYRIAPADVPSELGAFASQPAVVLVDNAVVKVQPSGLSSRYVQLVIQVLQAGAAQQLQYFPIAFDPDREEVRVLEASVLKADGRRVHAETVVTDALSEPQYRLYYRNRNMILSFPSVSAGDRLWIEYKVTEVGEESDYGTYFGDIVPFAGRTPIILKQYTLLAPESLPLFVAEERMLEKAMVFTRAGERIHCWSVRQIERVQSEPGAPGLFELVPYIHVSTFSDWDAMGVWYARFIADQWEMTPEVKAKVADLTRSLTSPEEKVRAIHRWVVQQTHYVGLEFGVHGYRPYKVRQIFERRFGDCKDKAILMAAMLREAGVDAAMVMVRTRDNGEIAPSPASLAVFNHAICYVPGLDLFLDGTAEYSGLRELPGMDRGVWVQVVWPDGRTRRVKTPEDGPGDNTYEARYEIDVTGAAADLPFSNEIAITGQECAWLRRRYQETANQREVLERDLSNGYPGTHLDGVTVSPLADLSSPLRLSLRGTLGQAARLEGRGRLTLPVWMGHLNLLYDVAVLEQRTLPLVLDYPWIQTYRVSYELPEGASAAPPAPIREESPFGTVSRSFVREGGALVSTVTIELKARRVEVGDYKAFKAFCQLAERATQDRIRIDLKGGQP
jgi:transglutaminase-like putative cysteine protease/tetratricopeptide (TPR) repeat protein